MHGKDFYTDCRTTEVDVAILDGAVVVQMASPGAARPFQEYADNVFMSYIMKQLQSKVSYQREEGLWYTQKDKILFPVSEELEEFLTRE